jgi:hypothetical protein
MILLSKSGKLLNALIELCPTFAESWAGDAYLWTDDTGKYTVFGVFSAFSSYISDTLIGGGAPFLGEVFRFVERCMSEDEEMGTATTTCFLENLMNRVPETLDPSTFVPLLGPESRAYCRAWDEFCGTKTDGLW